MGALSGSISYTRFFVEGELPADFRKQFVEAVRRDVFVPLTVECEDDERTGWCSIEHPFDLDLNAHNVFFNEYLNLGFRTDKYRLPGSIVKAHYVQAERKYMAEHNKERLSREEKENIKAIVEARLKRQVLPGMKVIDMSWNTQTGHVRLWNQSPGTCEQFALFFEDTFGLQIVPESPYTAAIQYDLSDELASRLVNAEPTVFHTAA